MAPSADKASDKTAGKKTKLVRDSFSIPKAEFAAIDTLKTRAVALGTPVKKSELLRAGLMLLQNLGDKDYRAALAAVPTLKTGRPAAEPVKADPAPAPKKARTVKAAPGKPEAKKVAPTTATPAKAPSRRKASAPVKAAPSANTAPRKARSA